MIRQYKNIGSLIYFSKFFKSQKFPKLNFIFYNPMQSLIKKDHLISFQFANFSEKKKGGAGHENKKNEKKAKLEKEKEAINREYEDVGVEDLTSKYKAQVDEIVASFKENIDEIKLSRNNPKIFDHLLVLHKSKKLKLGDIATVMIRGTNVLVINPYDADHRDSIIKTVETSKMDVQITTEDSNVVVTLGAIPQDMKNEYLQSAKKLFEKSKESIKSSRHSAVNEIKKLEKILSKDEARRIEKNILDNIERQLKSMEQTYKRKEEEIKSV